MALKTRRTYAEESRVHSCEKILAGAAEERRTTPAEIQSTSSGAARGTHLQDVRSTAPPAAGGRPFSNGAHIHFA